MDYEELKEIKEREEKELKDYYKKKNQLRGKMKKRKFKIKNFNILVSKPLIAASCGLGIFFLYSYSNMDIMFTLLISLYVSAIIGSLLKELK